SDVWIDKVIVVDKTDGSGVVAGVSVAPREITLANGQSSLLTTTILPSNAANQSVTWSSDNTSVADVDTAGKVTAAAPGSAVITATTVDGGFTATSTVTVHPEGTNAIKNHQFDDDSEWVLYDWSSEGGSTWS